MVNEIRTPETEDVVGAFGDYRVESLHRLNKTRKRIIVNQLGIPENFRLLAEKILYHRAVLIDLLDKFVLRLQKAQAVIISFAEKFHTPCPGQGVECAYHFRRILLELLEQTAGYAVGNPEFAFVFIYQIQHKTVRRQVALVRHLSADKRVLMLVKIPVVAVKDGVVSKPDRLMDLKIETYRSHTYYLGLVL